MESPNSQEVNAKAQRKMKQEGREAAIGWMVRKPTGGGVEI